MDNANIIQWILGAIVILYGMLMVLAVLAQIRKEGISICSTILMLVGGVLLIVSVIGNLWFNFKMIYGIIVGLVLIHFAAIRNGYRMHGRLNLWHHAIRLFFSLGILALYMIN